MALQVSRISKTAAQLGESPVWDVTRQRLYWVDGVSRRIHAYEPERGIARHWDAPSMVGSVGLGQGDTLVAALADGIYRFDLGSGELTPLFRPDPCDPRLRFNDGKVDRWGRFLCGTMGVHAEPLGQLFRIDAGGAHTVLAHGIRISNALCFSPDGRMMYFADSLDRAIRAYSYWPGEAFDPEPRIVIDTGPYQSGPDGATVDCDGCLWVALVQVGKIARFTPQGKLDRLIDAPTDLPSSVAFGGPELSTLYVTSIKDSGSGRAVSRHPDGGFLFAIDGLGATGLPEAQFGLQPTPPS
ncbi:SMP-30/gluconolactonase/LRE family protein [Bradyrhizobium sp. CCGUVB1N3]|uniref:SMP-30/gluconolactonase/LRE family protein n=1 Tax=Bradyrhizobium sp. CCGUVB1N3 TaxID=2949629 RepID=UPI0020B2CAE1|nr:SMP-30/gluconolactonase/LRE family protein [Bradyrhizobium sp. CCGUVB1N3]MCP3468818.1 SMP-30/gluconolactonase/LRE family protein [Bradyrhizobium sp. CCGUVB1N3]